MNRSAGELTDGQLAKIAAELREIAHGSSWSRTLATGELVLNHFFGGDIDEWRAHRQKKDASIRRLAQRPDCPLGKSALSEAVAIFVARRTLPKLVEELTPSHVAVALRLPPAERLALIEKAVAGLWSVRRIRAEALTLRRRAGERRGRPRFSEARAALSRFKASLEALESGRELLDEPSDADAETLGLIERTLAAFEQKLEAARVAIAALAGPGLRSAPHASLVVPAVKGRLVG